VRAVSDVLARLAPSSPDALTLALALALAQNPRIKVQPRSGRGYIVGGQG
jgi:hypothetical protein